MSGAHGGSASILRPRSQDLTSAPFLHTGWLKSLRVDYSSEGEPGVMGSPH